MTPIALITDFGLADHFVGSMKGAILGVNPKAAIIDICHNVPAGDVLTGAFTLLMSFRDFPKPTIFVVVVDPGVGSNRAAIAVKCGTSFFIGPDNGVLSLAVDKAGKAPVIRRLENNRYFRLPVSGTFHGRDIFGPVAAHVSKGVAFKKLGPVHQSFERTHLPEVRVKSDRILGEVVHIDHFGNCVTAIDESHLNRFPNKNLFVFLKDVEPIPACSCYANVGAGKPLAIVGSAGFLEICVNSGNAAEKLNLKRGDEIEIRFR